MPRAGLRLLTVLLLVGGSAAAEMPGRLLQEWDFERSLEEWYAAHSVAPLLHRQGQMVIEVTGHDPYIHSSRGPSFELQGNSRQYISLRARCSHSGTAEFFWTDVVEGGDAGFVAGKEVAFSLVGDHQFHVYNVVPDWQGRITRLRFDPPDLQGRRQVIVIDYIRILELPEEFHPGPGWDFRRGRQGFMPKRDLTAFARTPMGMKLVGLGESPTWQIAGLSWDAPLLPWVSVQLQTSQPLELTIQWRTSTEDYSPRRSVSLPVAAAPQGRYVNFCVGEHEQWKGEITGLRLQWKGRKGPGPTPIILRSLALSDVPLGPPELSLLSVHTDRAVTIAGYGNVVRAQVRNTGGQTVTNLQASLELPGGWRAEPSRLELESLRPGQKAQLAFRVNALAPAVGQAIVSVASPDAPPVRGPVDVLASQALTSLDTDAWMRASPAGQLEDSTVFLASRNARLIIPRNPYGYGPLFLYARTGAGWFRAATTPYLSYLIYAEGENLLGRKIFPEEVLFSTKPDARLLLEFRSRWEDNLHREWVFKAFFAPTANPYLFQTTYILRCQAPAALYRFDGPMLLAGDGSFGAYKRQALFPGLEYLEAEERSSSSRDLAPPHHLRLTPHPHRITVPLMAVTSPEGVLVGLLWNLRQQWTPGKDSPTAIFASPNFVSQQKNHLLGLMLPSVPDYIPENGTQAQRPFLLQPGQPVELRSFLLVKPNAQVLDAVQVWYDHYGPSEPQPAPRPVEEVYRLSLRSFEEMLYQEGRGWSGVRGRTPSPSPLTGLLYVLLEGELGADSPVPNLRQKARERAYQGYGLPLALHIGGVEEALLRAYQEGLSALVQRTPQGKWVFRPTERTKSLGRAGETVVGLGAQPVRTILRAAAQTADEQLLREGRRGLAFLDRFRVPRGAQTWEVPLHAPDLLAAARTADAYLWGYKLTGERKYLDKAVYWAQAGLPFIYVWQAGEPELAPMQGGSIPVFGATFYTHSWLGRVVQWNGLEYAAVLLDLAQYDHRLDWQRIAQSIIHSGLRQQRTEPNYLGLYPDSWSMLEGTISWGLMLGPQRLVYDLLKLQGRHPEGHLRLFRAGEQLIALNTVGDLAGVRVGRGALGDVVTEVGEVPFDARFTVTYPLAPHSYAALLGVSPPQMVSINGVVVPQVEEVETSGVGWEYSAALGGLLLKLPHRAEEGFAARVEVRGLKPADPRRGRRRWTFDRAPQGWRAWHDVEPLRVANGALQVVVTGEDPYLGFPPLPFPAEEVSQCVLRLRSRRDAGSVQLFWARKGEGFVPERSVVAGVEAGPQWQRIVLPLRGKPGWEGTITALRLDLPGQAGNWVEIDQVELQ